MNFPALATLYYPEWIYSIIFLLSGVAALFIPGVALFKLIQKHCCKKQKHTTEAIISISAGINMTDEADERYKNINTLHSDNHS